ncbi:protein kinase [Anaeramoeba ignava]|uniref:non-specific serine/threonine protein kinase n=1 Tax=Anaeramoeba ignava TaxID=1746090 RepID=A0A9Q0LPQ0_ANAIG|nr:protein kinase [Anaeramoeba ignava]
MEHQLKNYFVCETIGEGAFAKVKIARHILSNTKVAVKIIDKKAYAQNSDSLNRLQIELNALKLIDHPNIVKLYETVNTKKYFYIVTEYVANGELLTYINENGKMSERKARGFFKQIVDAIEHCHQLGVAHRDIKLENLLLDANNNIKIIDFGLAGEMKTDNWLCKTACGSPSYSAPEVIQGKRYQGKKSDVWSMGVVLYAMVCAALPFNGKNVREICENIVIGEFSIPDDISQSCKHLIRHMIEKDTRKRYTVSQIKLHPWFNEQDTDSPRFIEIPTPIKELNHAQIDPMILKQMEQAGFTAKQVAFSIQQQRFDSSTATYRLLLDKRKNENSPRSERIVKTWKIQNSHLDTNIDITNTIDLTDTESSEEIDLDEINEAQNKKMEKAKKENQNQKNQNENQKTNQNQNQKTNQKNQKSKKPIPENKSKIKKQIKKIKNQKNQSN